MIILSPLIVVLMIIGTILSLLYMPFDYMIYKKYPGESEYKLFYSIKNRKQIKELKKKSQV